jgi:hypothetical protein
MVRSAHAFSRRSYRSVAAPDPQRRRTADFTCPARLPISLRDGAAGATARVTPAGPAGWVVFSRGDAQAASNPTQRLAWTRRTPKKGNVSIGVIVAVFGAGSALAVWHWIAATKQVSDELLKEYQRLLSDARVSDPPPEDPPAR